MSKTTTRNIPSLRYEDGEKAIEWLCSVLGFKRHLVVPGENGGVAHAQLTYDGTMIMLSDHSHGGPYADAMRSPKMLDGVNSMSIYMVIEEIDAHYQRVKAAGAKIVIEIKDEDYGGRGYSCRDIEGHLWSFGSYDPWISDPQE